MPEAAATVFAMRMRGLLLQAVLACLLAPPAAAADAAPEAPSSVQDLRYGVVLYHFYQDEYFDALTELSIGDQRQDMPHHGEFAQLLRGGISLSYGMDAQARAIFDQLLAQHPKPEVRDRAWFYLGKNFYERRDDATAQAMLDRSGDHLPDSLRDERDYLRANMALRDGAVDSADALRKNLRNSDDRPNPWLPYLEFNRGALAVGTADWSTATAQFGAAAATPLRDEEHKALRDRALVAAGYAYLGASDPKNALAAFRQVRLNGPFADNALLGYGWAALQVEDYALALQPWQTLHERSPLSPAVQESLLAVPYAYEKMQAQAEALAEYERAEQLFHQEIARIDAAQQQLQTMPLLSLWLDPKNTDEWISRRQELPVVTQIPYLEHLLSLNTIQDGIRDMRDLAQLERYLVDWQDRLAALDVAQALQYQRRQHVLREHPERQLDETYERLQKRRDELLATLQQADRSGDGRALMTGEELAIARRLQRVRGRIDALRDAGQPVDEYEAKYRFYSGLQTWTAQAEYAARRRAATLALRDLEQELAVAGQRKAQLGGLLERAHAPEQGERIRALQVRLQASLQNIQRAQRDGEKVLRDAARAELQAQRARLNVYLARAQLAKARLYDKGTTEAPR